jgi:hypothetical protein
MFRDCISSIPGETVIPLWLDRHFLVCENKVNHELKITPILDKLLEYKRNWIQHVNRMPRNRLPRIMKHYSPSGRRNHGRPLKRLLGTQDRNGSTSGRTPWQIPYSLYLQIKLSFYGTWCQKIFT